MSIGQEKSRTQAKDIDHSFENDEQKEDEEDKLERVSLEASETILSSESHYDSRANMPFDQDNNCKSLKEELKAACESSQSMYLSGDSSSEIDSTTCTIIPNSPRLSPSGSRPSHGLSSNSLQNCDKTGCEMLNDALIRVENPIDSAQNTANSSTIINDIANISSDEQLILSARHLETLSDGKLVNRRLRVKEILLDSCSRGESNLESNQKSTYKQSDANQSIEDGQTVSKSIKITYVNDITNDNDEKLVEIDLGHNRVENSEIKFLNSSNFNEQDSASTNEMLVHSCYNNPSIGQANNTNNNFDIFEPRARPNAISAETPIRQHYHQETSRGFRDAKPKLSFASKQMKEYFETFRSSNSAHESARLYQFFKSIRTEFIACLLFSLIVSQTMVTLRTSFTNVATTTQYRADYATTDQQMEPIKAEANDRASSDQYNANFQPITTSRRYHQSSSEQQQHSKHLLAMVSLQSGDTNKHHWGALIHLASGLVMAFTVATLTQVFGHISGCHLIPAISLALYFKGHISRARLASYLVAQSLGALLGIGLLGLLTGSQMTPAEFASATLSNLETVKPLPRIQPAGQLQLRSELGKQIATASEPASRWGRESIQLTGLQNVASLSLVEHQQVARRTKRHATQVSTVNNVDQPIKLAGDGRSNHYEHPRSENILLEIMDQKPWQLEQLKRLTFNQSLKQQHQAFGELKTFNVSNGAIVIDKHSEIGEQKYQDSSNASKSSPHSEQRVVELHAISKIDSNNASISPSNDSNISSSQVSLAIASLAHNLQKNINHKDISSSDVIRANQSPEMMIGALPSKKEPQLINVTEMSINIPTTTGTRVRVRRKRRQQISRQVKSVNASRDSDQLEIFASLTNSNDDHYINLLEFALPDEIMSSDSIRQCIEIRKQLRNRNSSSIDGSLPGASNSMIDATTLLLQDTFGASFRHCLSLSNASQMFIFQLLATILIVLTYLINVDPRRIDLGYKSLSIGLSYLLATTLASKSGGFYGNPMHLIALNWFSSPPIANATMVPQDGWRSEWFIYLISPLIGGLFGALSHEYIDFTSLRNRNKRQQLRRSFYSLDDMQQQHKQRSKASGNAAQIVASNNDELQQSNGHLKRPNMEPLVHSSSSSLASSCMNKILGYNDDDQDATASGHANSSIMTLQLIPPTQQQQQQQLEHQKHDEFHQLDIGSQQRLATGHRNRQQQQQLFIGSTLAVTGATALPAATTRRQTGTRKVNTTPTTSSSSSSSTYSRQLRLERQFKLEAEQQQHMQLQQCQQMVASAHLGPSAHEDASEIAVIQHEPTCSFNHHNRLLHQSRPSAGSNQAASRMIASQKKQSQYSAHHNHRRRSEYDSNFLISSSSSVCSIP